MSVSNPFQHPVPPPPQILADQLTLSQPAQGEQIIPIKWPLEFLDPPAAL